MRIEGETIICKTNSTLYIVERMGLKPYTVRLVTIDESKRVLSDDVTMIRIANATAPENTFFERNIRSKFILGELLGHLLVGIAWIHEEENETPEQ